jgi:diguanylate cyclase (GGDEF)-like protein/PAS domain S-box-containing protein
MKLFGNSVKPETKAPVSAEFAALDRLSKINEKLAAHDQDAVLQALLAQASRYKTALESVSQGVCYFDREQRLVLANTRFAEIYKLNQEDIAPGTTLREIADRRVEVGTSPMATDEYLAWCAEIVSGNDPKTWTLDLSDGRTIHVCHQPMVEGGWVATHEDITAVKAQRSAAKDLTSLQTLIDWVPDYLWVKDLDSRFVVINKALATDGGRSNPSEMIGLSDFDFHAPELATNFRNDEREILRGGKPMVNKEEYVIDAQGAKKWLSSTKVPLRDEKNEIFGLIGIARDITEQKKADILRNGQAQILEMIALNSSLDEVLDKLVRLVESQLTDIQCSVLLLDADGLHLRSGAAPSLPEAYCKAIDGVRIGPNVGSCGTAVYRRETVIVKDIATDPLWADYTELAAGFNLRSCWSTPILSHQGAVLGTFALYSATIKEPTAAETNLIDVSTRIAGIAIERKLAEERIHFMANHDSLTGLPNRTLLKDRLSQAILYAQRYDNWVTVVFVDLDNFKTVNDSLGHGAGDELLRTVAQRMKESVRSTDTVVRLGGDEFVILLRDQPKDADIISETLQKIMTTIGQSVQLEGHDLKVTSSIGIANYPNDGMDTETLLANADAAMYRAKEVGRDNFQFYRPEMNIKVHEKFILQEELRNAVTRAEFVLLYQPQVDLRTGKVFAVEALVRWNHPTHGMLAPGKFIPVAEETGLIVSIGDWVLHEACRQNKVWQDAGLMHMSICVNVSPRQFREKNLIARVRHALEESGLDAKYLELEITESLIMQNVEQSVATMEALEELGVQISIDDFGTGYSSLSALKTFPVARLKIDKSFINNLPSNDGDRAIASAVISLGQKLNLRVIAEGVETTAQVAFLRENNCDEMQGYHFSKPIHAHDIDHLIRAATKK